MSGYVGTNALAAINIVYPIVNILTGIALIFATGGSSITALYIGGNEKEAAFFAANEMLPLMDAIRKLTDSIEKNVSKDDWPIPDYNEILFKSVE